MLFFSFYYNFFGQELLRLFRLTRCRRLGRSRVSPNDWNNVRRLARHPSRPTSGIFTYTAVGAVHNSATEYGKPSIIRTLRREIWTLNIANNTLIYDYHYYNNNLCRPDAARDCSPGNRSTTANVRPPPPSRPTIYQLPRAVMFRPSETDGDGLD